MYTACLYKFVSLSMVIMFFWNYNVANLAIFIFGASSVEVIMVFFYRFGDCGEGSRRG